MKITSDKSCQNASTTKPQEDFPVDGSPGLVLRVTGDGTKTWAMRYRHVVGGKETRRRLERQRSQKPHCGRVDSFTRFPCLPAAGLILARLAAQTGLPPCTRSGAQLPNPQFFVLKTKD